MPEDSKLTGDKSLVWLSPEWNRVFKGAVDAAQERGMVADAIVGTGWPFGGEFLEPHERNQIIDVTKKPLQGPGMFQSSVKELLTRPKTRHPLPNPPSMSLAFLRLVPAGITNLSQVINLAEKVKPDGSVSFEIPPGSYFLYTGTRAIDYSEVRLGAPGGAGPVLDHYNGDAVRKYLERTSKHLGPVFGGKLGNGLRAMFCDSIELAGANWTPDLPQQFRKRRGYELEPWLPFVLDTNAIVHNVVTGWEDHVRRARYDFSLTLVELFRERFILPFHNWCHEQGTLSRYQAYGLPFLMGMLDGYMIPDIPEGDTWLFHRDWLVSNLDNIRYNPWNKYASSGAHIRGRAITSCEAMTETTGAFKATLNDIKQADDLNFFTGVNHTIVHGFNYSPPEAGFPGWYRFGTYFNENNPWWQHVRHWTDYNARLSWVLQNSQPQVRVAIMTPEADVWSEVGLERTAYCGTPWYSHELWQAFHQNGISADYISDTVLANASCKSGILRAGSMQYELLVLTEVHTLSPATARTLERFAATGGRIAFLGSAPVRSPCMKNADAGNRSVKKSVDAALQGGTRAAIVPGPREPAELVRWAGGLLRRFDVLPDVQISAPNDRLFQLHHRANSRDVFFFSNLDRKRPVRFNARFDKISAGSVPWWWNPETGERALYPHKSESNKLDIDLQPLESLLLVFDTETNGSMATLPVIPSQRDTLIITNSWALQLQPVRGEVFRKELSLLVPLGKTGDTDLDTFGGNVTYSTEFKVSDEKHSVLDLGEVDGVSEVTLNGQSLGVRWHGRHVYDASGSVRKGKNLLQVKVAVPLFNYCRTLPDPGVRRWIANTRTGDTIPVGMIGPVTMCAAEQR